MKNILVRHAYEIFDLSVKSGVDVGIAMEYFANNCHTYPTIYHKALDFDYKEVSKEWESMNIEQKCDAKIYWSSLIKDSYHELGNAFAAHDKEKFVSIVEKFMKE